MSPWQKRKPRSAVDSQLFCKRTPCVTMLKASIQRGQALTAGKAQAVFSFAEENV